MDASPSESASSSSHKIESTEKDDSASTSTEKTEDPSKKRIFNHFNFTVYVEASEKRVQQENHLNRLQKLRKELNHIKETDWQYEPIEKYIGQL